MTRTIKITWGTQGNIRQQVEDFGHGELTDEEVSEAVDDILRIINREIMSKGYNAYYDSTCELTYEEEADIDYDIDMDAIASDAFGEYFGV